MVITWLDVLVQREHHQDLLCALEHDRLVRQTLAGRGRAGARFYHRLLAWIGHRLVAWGERPRMQPACPVRSASRWVSTER